MGRGLCTCAAAVLILTWSLGPDKAGIRSYVMSQIFEPRAVLAMLASYVRAKALSTLAGTDGLMATFGDGLLWSIDGDPQGYEAQIGVVRNLRLLAGEDGAEPPPGPTPEIDAMTSVELSENTKHGIGVNPSSIVPGSGSGNGTSGLVPAQP